MHDDKIIEMMHEQESNHHYGRYIMDRFVVIDIHDTPEGLCALIEDKETGERRKYYSGDQIADGAIDEIMAEGVVFRPPRADVPKMMLKGSKEMRPIGGDKQTSYRSTMNQQLKSEHGRYRPQDDELAIVIVSDEY